MFGLGELSTGEGGIYSGLGGVGIALRGENVINDANPASLTGLLPQYFFFDLGVSGSYLKYSQSGASNHSLNGNLNNLAVGFRIAPRWYGAIFMAPVSSVGYAISLDQDVAGTDGSTVTSLFQGEGGLSDCLGFSSLQAANRVLTMGQTEKSAPLKEKENVSRTKTVFSLLHLRQGRRKADSKNRSSNIGQQSSAEIS
jgi:hypothetical protein